MSSNLKLSSLDQLFNYASDYASSTIQESGRLGPSILILSADGSVFFLSGDTSDAGAKDLFLKEARLACIAYGADAVVFASEAWMSRDSSVRPFESSDREEILLLLGESYEARKSELRRVLRSESGCVSGFAECVDLPLDKVRGRFTNILPLRRPPIEHQISAKKLLAEMGITNRIIVLSTRCVDQGMTGGALL